MEEPRRLQFTTIGPSNREKKKQAPCQTIRINLDLTEANDDSCPEFSYVELLKNAVGEPKDGENLPETEPDPFGDFKEDDKLAEIAKKFEAKYGPKPGKGKRKHERIQDLVDLGEGYDETDNFIDNSEAYDEIVPACLTTKLGGFYINSGVLDFREVSDDSEDAFTTVNGSAKKKRKAQRITSESESDGEVVLKKKRGPKPKKKFQDGFAGKKRKRLSAEGEKMFKRPKKPIDKWKRKKRSPTVSELLKQHAASTSSSVNGTEGSSGITNASGDLHNGTNIDSAIESVVSRVLEDSQSDERSSPENPETVPKLPAGLSARLEETITKLKKAAKDSREGKCRFFTHDVNRMLLLVEQESQKVSCGTRQIIYIHLAAYLPCSKETLLKRAKKLRLNENDDKLKEPIQRLRDAINSIMPAQLERHAQECRLAAQVRLLEGKELTREDASTESDDEKSASEGEKKRHMSPRRKFEWSAETRVLLCEIVSIKMKTYDLSKLRTQSAEEYLKSFLDAEIKPIWPKGWMQTRMLYKESRTAHDPWTNPARPKKSVIITKAADSGTRSAGNSQDGALQRPTEVASKLETGHAGPIALVSSTDDKIQRELKPGHVGALMSDPPKCQVSSTNKGSASLDIPTLLDYAGVSIGSSQPKVAVDSTVSSSRLAVDLAVKPVRKPSVVDLTSPPSAWTKPEETDTHNIAMEILKSMRQLPQVSRPHDTNQPGPKASTSNKPTSTESSNSSFLAQFKKYAISALSEQDKNSMLKPAVSVLQDSKVATSPQTPSPSSSTKTEQSQMWTKGKAGEITPGAVSSSAHSVPPKQVSPNQRVSPQQEKAHSSERKPSPFTLLHQQLEQQQQQQQQQKQKPRQPDTVVRSKDPIPSKSQQSKSPQVSPVGGADKAAYLSKEGKPSPHPHLLSQQIHQQIQQNYLSMLHKSHGVGQSKPPQPPNSAQGAKHQSLLAAAISNTGVVSEGSHSQGSVPRKASAPPASRYSPGAATSMASSSQDRSVNKAPPRTSHSSSHPNQTMHKTSLLSLKKKLISDTHTSHAATAAATSSSQIKRPAKSAAMAHTLTAAQSQASMLASHSAAWSLLSFANSSTTPPTAHSSSALTNAALTSAFSPPLAHAQIQGSSRSSPNYPVSVLPGGKKTPSPTSSLHHQSRSPDNGRAVVSSTVPYSQAQLSPRNTLSPRGSPLGSLFAGHSLHSPNSPHTAASPHNSNRSPHGY
ncbi:ubinuclein-2-like isoform X2 [Liolophura sinensis]|uniref:ubinuclein-2-like isoform X2 n=1 Tax=Liolophura sinensis TaxID=3198878 RepID=UPI00315823EE